MLTYKDKQLNDKIERAMRRALGVFVAGFIVFRIILLIKEECVFPIAFLLLYLAGLSTSMLLLLKTHGFHSGIINRFCSSKVGRDDCLSVIGSKGAFLIGEVSWCDVGMIYFLSMLVITLFFPFRENVSVYMLSSFLTFPYVVFSLCYQKFVIHSWCRLCLIVQMILLLSIGNAVWILTSGISVCCWADWMEMIITVLVVITSWFTIKYFVRTVLLKKALTEQNRQIKFAYPECMFYRSAALVPLQDSERIIYNEGARDKVTVAFRFDCYSCLHGMGKIIETIRKNSGIAVEFVFVSWASKVKSDLPFMLYFTSLYLRNREEFLHELECYVADFPHSISRYAVHPEEICAQARRIIVSHVKWVKDNGINQTPTYLLNDRIVSEFYSFSEVLEMLYKQREFS